MRWGTKTNEDGVVIKFGVLEFLLFEIAWRERCGDPRCSRLMKGPESWSVHCLARRYVDDDSLTHSAPSLVLVSILAIACHLNHSALVSESLVLTAPNKPQLRK